jgi:hypothetical protein
MQVVHLDTESPTTLGGFRGMGEGGTIGAPAAVANALADALSPLGIAVGELPATPERLFRLIAAAKKSREEAWTSHSTARWRWVTGAARDVGREIALTLAAEGAAVAVNYLSSAAEAEAVVSDIAAKGGKAKAYKADVSDYDAVKAMVDAVVTDFGALNILVNNAGLAKRQRFTDTTPDDWKNQIDICLYGAIHCSHAAAPHLGKREERPHRQRDRGLLARRRVRSGDCRCGARGRRRADEVAGARVRPLRHDREHGVARTGRDRA